MRCQHCAKLWPAGRTVTAQALTKCRASKGVHDGEGFDYPTGLHGVITRIVSR